MISHKYKCIFIHIPKTGGTSIKKVLKMEGKYYHQTAKESRELYKEYWDQYFKFAVVRNPWDRVCSIFHYYKYGIEKTNEFIRKLLVNVSFEQFCYYLCGDNPMDWMKDFAITEKAHQYNWLTINGDLTLDFIVKFENLKQDFQKIIEIFTNKGIDAANLQLGHERRSKHKPYKDYYNSSLVELVQNKFLLDINKFGYMFD